MCTCLNPNVDSCFQERDRGWLRIWNLGFLPSRPQVCGFVDLVAYSFGLDHLYFRLLSTCLLIGSVLGSVGGFEHCLPVASVWGVTCVTSTLESFFQFQRQCDRENLSALFWPGLSPTRYFDFLSYILSWLETCHVDHTALNSLAYLVLGLQIVALWVLWKDQPLPG